MAAVTFVTPAGHFDQQAWHDYFSALWSSPTQPGYPTVVREGLAALKQIAETIQLTANANGATDAASYAAEALAQLPTYMAIAAASQDGPFLRKNVVDPLLTQPNAPLLKIGIAIPLVLAFKPLRTWGTIFDEEVVAPTVRASKAIARVGAPLLLIAAGLVAAYFLSQGDA